MKPLIALLYLLLAPCAIVSAQVGHPYATGLNDNGQLGDGTILNRNTFQPTAPLKNIIQLASGVMHSLALDKDGNVWAWGGNSAGQLGIGTQDPVKTPTRVVGLSNVIYITAGYYHSLAVKSDGTVWAWGANESKQLGDGTKINRYTPVQALYITDAVQVSAGISHSMALGAQGGVRSWGANSHGQGGDIGPLGKDNNVQISAGAASCSRLMATGFVYQWGKNCSSGWDGSTVQDGGGIVSYEGPIGEHLQFSGVVAIARGKYHTLAIKSDGTVWNWSDDGAWQPRQITSIPNAVGIYGGSKFSFFVQADGTVWGHGSNKKGQLGSGDNVDHQTLFPIQGLSSPTIFGAGIDHSLCVQAAVLNTKVTVSKITALYGSITLSATLKSSLFNSSVINVPVTFAIDGVAVGTAYTWANGKATLSVPNAANYGVGTYTVTATFNGDLLHYASTNSAILTVKQSPTTLSMSSVSGRPGDTKNIKATLKRKSDNALLSGNTITFQIDGSIVGTATTDGTGAATLPYKVSEIYAVGAHTLTADYAGYTNQAASTAKATLTINQSPTKISSSSLSGKVGTIVTLKAKLTRQTDKSLLTGKTVRFQIDGVDIGTALTDGVNTTTLPYTIPSTLTAGKHTITVAFDGDTFYLTSSDSNATLTVK